MIMLNRSIYKYHYVRFTLRILLAENPCLKESGERLTFEFKVLSFLIEIHSSRAIINDSVMFLPEESVLTSEIRLSGINAVTFIKKIYDTLSYDVIKLYK